MHYPHAFDPECSPVCVCVHESMRACAAPSLLEIDCLVALCTTAYTHRHCCSHTSERIAWCTPRQCERCRNPQHGSQIPEVRALQVLLTCWNCFSYLFKNEHPQASVANCNSTTMTIQPIVIFGRCSNIMIRFEI